MTTPADGGAGGPSGVSDRDSVFLDARQRLQRGDFSQLAPLFERDSTGADARAPIVRWHVERRFDDDPEALAEALTCACFLGQADVAEYFLRQGVTPLGGAATGLNAFHWAVNRGQLEAVRLLIRWRALFGTRSMHGGNVLDTAVWSAINEPRPDHLRIIEELVEAGARLEQEPFPTGHADIDEILRRSQ
jgi:hypothetical protein